MAQPGLFTGSNSNGSKVLKPKPDSHRDTNVISYRYRRNEPEKMKHERETHPAPGMLMLLLLIAALVSIIYGGFRIITSAPSPDMTPVVPLLLLVLALVVWTVLIAGFFIVEPNGSKVLLLFGSYKGTVKKAGFHWANPFLSKRSLSLRARTLNGEKLKVNDLAGNPVEIAAIIVWQVVDTFDASFEVEDCEQFVKFQSETAVRHSASSYPYDAPDDTLSLQRNSEEVSEHMKEELQQRLALAGVRILEARLSHLAYSAEIAGAMLRRQQAAAIIAARTKIVEGAVGMVEMALERLEKETTLNLDDERKAAMVSNLMVVLCSEHAAQPVVNAGTLYTG